MARVAAPPVPIPPRGPVAPSPGPPTPGAGAIAGVLGCSSTPSSPLPPAICTPWPNVGIPNNHCLCGLSVHVGHIREAWEVDDGWDVEDQVQNLEPNVSCNTLQRERNVAAVESNRDWCRKDW